MSIESKIYWTKIRSNNPIYANSSSRTNYTSEEVEQNDNDLLLKLIKKLIYHTEYGNNNNDIFIDNEAKLHPFLIFLALFDCLKYKLMKRNINLNAFP